MTDGVLAPHPGAARTMKVEFVNPDVDPVSGLQLVAPFSRRLEPDGRVDEPLVTGTAQLVHLLQAGPLHVGTTSKESLTRGAPESGCVVLRAMSACCGVGICGTVCLFVSESVPKCGLMSVTHRGQQMLHGTLSGVVSWHHLSSNESP